MPLRDVTSIVLGTTVMLIALFGVLFVFSSQCFAPSDPRTARVQPTATSVLAQGSAGQPSSTPSSDDGPPATTTAPTNTPQPTAPPATATPVPAAAATPTAIPPAQPTAAAPAPGATANFNGAWQVVDTVTSGSGVGQTFSFDVMLVQQGSQISGGNSGLQISGTINGQTVTATYTQPALGITGTFTWTMLSSGNSAGTFTSSVPNSGTSLLLRR